jgi:hypothetical protein
MIRQRNGKKIITKRRKQPSTEKVKKLALSIALQTCIRAGLMAYKMRLTTSKLILRR